MRIISVRSSCHKSITNLVLTYGWIPVQKLLSVVCVSWQQNHLETRSRVRCCFIENFHVWRGAFPTMPIYVLAAGALKIFVRNIQALFDGGVNGSFCIDDDLGNTITVIGELVSEPWSRISSTANWRILFHEPVVPAVQCNSHKALAAQSLILAILMAHNFARSNFSRLIFGVFWSHRSTRTSYSTWWPDGEHPWRSREFVLRKHIENIEKWVLQLWWRLFNRYDLVLVEKKSVLYNFLFNPFMQERNFWAIQYRIFRQHYFFSKV